MVLKRKEAMQFLAEVTDVKMRCELLRSQLEQGYFSESDLIEYAPIDLQRNYADYKALLEAREGSAEILEYFYSDPTYLARALVILYPELFYMQGFAHRFVLKLRADLGPVLKRPNRAGRDSEPAIFLSSIPDAVQGSLAKLDEERRFRQYLYLFSRDPAIGFSQLEDDLRLASDAYTRQVLEGLLTYNQALAAMTFPDFVDQLHGSMFPSWHVRWWINRVRNQSRVLNMGDTGSQKTAFAVTMAHQCGSRKILIVCPARARDNWAREISDYFRQSQDIHVQDSTTRVQRDKVVAARWNVVGYTGIAQEVIRDVFVEYPFDCLILDECHYGKKATGPNGSNRGKACVDLIQRLKPAYGLGLSATPIENHPEEFGAVASFLRGDLFPDPSVFKRTRSYEPRLLRELFATQILSVELRDVVDLPPINPKPWEDLFGVSVIPMNTEQRELYEFIRENETRRLEGGAKVRCLLRATIHPHGLFQEFEWPAHMRGYFETPHLSTKLGWILDQAEEKIAEGAKVVIATGIYVKGVTSPSPGECEAWVHRQVSARFGGEHVLVLDGKIASQNKGGERDQRIKRWRKDPQARILLISIPACPDSLNLSVPAMPGVTKLWITTLSFPWVPPKQFLGRFWRRGLGVPVEYRVPILEGTVDENLLQLISDKWHGMQLFAAQVPLTESEMSLFDHGKRYRLLAPDCETSAQTVNFTGRRVRDLDEKQMQEFLGQHKGRMTNAQRFAEAFVKIHEGSAPGHIARFMNQIILSWEKEGLVQSSGILDAGCGPLTLERVLDQPVVGVDMNEYLLHMGREMSSHHGEQAQVGFLTRLPAEWEHHFDLTVASLVIDWASLRKLTATRVPVREAVLRDLVRVTSRLGRVWLTFTDQAMNAELFSLWCAMLERNEHQIVRELTGRVQAVDHADKPFAFWSLCFCPEGKPLGQVRPDELALVFERERMVMRRGKFKRKPDPSPEPPPTALVKHEQFMLVQVNGLRLTTEQAAAQAFLAEQKRLEWFGNAPWRSLLQAEKRRKQKPE